MDEIVNRPEYLNRLIEYRGSDLIKVITGIRRCGKSTLMALYADYLRAQGAADENIIRMNLESLRWRQLRDASSLYDHLAAQMGGEGKKYLLLDEVQAVPGWERAVESLRLDFDTDVTITGSNAFLLSSELSTLLSGRYVEIRMLPLSFREFLDFYEFPPDTSREERFARYVQIGGMPGLRQFGTNVPRMMDALEGIYSTVILKDVMARGGIADQTALRKIVLFLLDNIGSLVSPGSIGKTLANESAFSEARARQRSLAPQTVEKYIQLLTDAFIFYKAERWDVRGKQLLKTLHKLYAADLGFRGMLLGFRDADRGRLLENVVYLELLRRDYRVFVGKLGDTEIDFVAEKPDRKLYIQVTESMTGEATRERELKPLRTVPDHYEKVVLSMDRDPNTSYVGIHSLNIIDFLLREGSFAI
ncbi:MAG: ATP-binding protein [Pyramidobacter sp.]|nr:ATP-binding protein [Pyramidobacter sp.]